MIILLLILPIFFSSCSKEENSIMESEIIFKVPIYKGDGITEYSDEVVYPNPFWDDLHVYGKLPEGRTAEVQITDGNGEFGWKETVSSGIHEIDTKDFPEGVYYIELKYDGYVDREKLLKTKGN